MYIACLCPNLVSVHFYAIPILHFKFSKFFIYLYNLPCTGHGLRLQHFRKNEECNVTEELEIIDENLRYDFNYQVHACDILFNTLLLTFMF